MPEDNSIDCPTCGGAGHVYKYGIIGYVDCIRCLGSGRLQFHYEHKQSNWSPIRCPHCGQLHEQPDADRQISLCAATLVDDGRRELFYLTYIPLPAQTMDDLREHKFLHAKSKHADP